MARVEKYGSRGIAWSIFHRTMPKPAYMIDLDYLECCQYCKEPLIIGELARDIGQSFKPATILLALARKAQVNAILIFYNESLILGKVKQLTGNTDLITIPTLIKEQLDILWNSLQEINQPVLRVIQIYPQGNKPEVRYTARQYFEYLQKIHQAHELNCKQYKLNNPLL